MCEEEWKEIIHFCFTSQNTWGILCSKELVHCHVAAFAAEEMSFSLFADNMGWIFMPEFCGWLLLKADAENTLFTDWNQLPIERHLPALAHRVDYFYPY